MFPCCNVYYFPLVTPKHSAVDMNQISTLLTKHKDGIGRVYGYIRARLTDYMEDVNHT